MSNINEMSYNFYGYKQKNVIQFLNNKWSPTIGFFQKSGVISKGKKVNTNGGQFQEK